MTSFARLRYEGAELGFAACFCAACAAVAVGVIEAAAAAAAAREAVLPA